MDMKKKKLESAIETAKIITTEDTFEALLPERKRPIGRYGRLHREYLKLNYPTVLEELIRSNTLWDYLAEINEQAEGRMKIASDDYPPSEVYKESEETIFTELICHFTPDR